MAYNNADIPLGAQESETDIPLTDAELQEVRPKRPQQIDDLYVGHAAMLSAEVNSQDIISAYRGVDRSVDPQILVRQLSFQHAEEMKQYLSDYFNKDITYSTPEEAISLAQTYQEVEQELSSNSAKSEKQFVDAIAEPNAAPEEVKKLEAELLLYNTLAAQIKDYSTFEKAIDIGKMLLPTSGIDNWQISGSVFAAEDYLRNVVLAFKDMRKNDPQQFIDAFPIFLDEIKDKLPKSKQLAILAAIENPRGEEGLKFFEASGAILDVIDVATLAPAVMNRVLKLTHSLNAVRTASRVRNEALAADINTAVVFDASDEAAKAAGIDKTTAASNAAPFNVGEIDAAYAANISTDSIQRINKVKAEQRRVAQLLSSEQGFLKEDILTPAERLVAEEDFAAQMRVQGIENMSVSSRTQKETVFTYQVKDPETGDVIAKDLVMPLQYDHITGAWLRTEEGMVADYLKSPTVLFKSAAEQVQQAIRMDSTSANIGEMLRKLQQEALEPILGKGGLLKSLSPTARKDLAVVDAALMSGDQFKDITGVRGKVYTPEELRSGVTGARLNDRQIEAYYNLRGLYDTLWVIRNNETRTHLVAQGMRQVKIGDVPAIGKNLSEEGARGVLNQEGTIHVYDATTDEIIALSGKDIGQHYANNKFLNTLKEEFRPASYPDEAFTYVLTRADAVDELPAKVLHFKEGYVPKVNENAYYFIKEIGPKTVNGKVLTGPTGQGVDLKTIRMFSSRAQAETWLRQNPNPKWVIREDREIEKSAFGSSQVGSGGGLYTGARASDDIPFGPEGLPAERLNVYEALGQNLHSLENYVSRNQWRHAMQQRWVNSAQAAGYPVRSWADRGLVTGDLAKGKGLERLAEQIDIWSGFPTAGELRWDGFLMRAQEWALNGRLPKAAEKIVVNTTNYLRRRENNPVNIARNVAFHSLLGVLNPAQLWVQAQGFSVAAALHPDGFVGALNSFRHQFGVAMVSNHLDNPGYVAHISKILQIPTAELLQRAKLWKRTGLEASALNTADHTSAVRGFGLARGALRNVLDKGLFFYKKGELFTRRFAFNVAFDRAYVKYGTFDLSDLQLKSVLSEANDMMLNLSKANRAAWQRGVAAIPTQFLQVQTKLIESLWGAQRKTRSGDVPASIAALDRRSANLAFTVQERMRILAYQVGLYGAAGIPLGGLGLRWAQESLGVTQADIENNPELVETLNGGFWGVIATQLYGTDIELSNRGAIAAGITEATLDLMFSDSPIADKALGAFGTIPQRGMDAWKKIKALRYGAGDEPLTEADILLGLNAVASITSTWNNAQKGWFMMNYGMMLDSKGRVAVTGPFDPMDAAAVSLGFQPLELKRIRDRNALVNSRKEYRAQVTETLLETSWLYVRELKGAANAAEEEKIIKKYNAANKFLMSTLRNEAEQEQVRKALYERLADPSDEKTKSIRAFIEEFADGQVLVIGSMVEAARANGLITNDLNLEEDK